ncbi:hypothetical protein F6R98_11240 [Candidatus Methylospira mobilis]|uniref:Uncharacterized protein n=1 Tax=Candidatus Methylospira mobilis TaxID=1808979 RepID=A0A5Q0BJ21_9GAMM|nr:hypothetical protein [Candidatus Methylospira mobilis]QFY43122.1 hypothetical protein F6R98_11240 [Candidatus Methylospira mobilis]
MENEFPSVAMANLANLAKFVPNEDAFSRFSQNSHSHPVRLKNDVAALAAELSGRNGQPLADVLALLDEPDKEAIETGSDPLRSQAWAFAVSQLPAASAIETVSVSLALVRCADCAHAQAVDYHTAQIKCGAGRPAPGACGTWWGLDKKICELYTPKL